MTFEPTPGDVCKPVTGSVDGCYVVRVDESFEDRVVFRQIRGGEVSDPIVNRLSTFVCRFELLHRPLVRIARD